MSVHKKLMQARIRLQNTELKKSGQNKFAGYNYFELGDFLPVVQNIFNEIGLCGVVSYTSETATLTITDTETDTSVQVTSPMGSAALKGCHEVQNVGAVETYQRRYLWVTAMEIVEHDVLDATTGDGKSEAVKPVKQALPKLTEEEAEKAYYDWLDTKVDLVDADPSVIANAWGKLPSNVRTAIKKYGETIAPVEQNDTATKQHIASIN